MESAPNAPLLKDLNHTTFAVASNSARDATDRQKSSPPYIIFRGNKHFYRVLPLNEALQVTAREFKQTSVSLKILLIHQMTIEATGSLRSVFTLLLYPGRRQRVQDSAEKLLQRYPSR